MTDGIRAPDEDNPKGYYEFEPVKRTKENPSWLCDAQGKVVKMVYRLLYDLPTDQYPYRVVFMDRDLREVLASQKVMLDRLDRDPGDLGDEQMLALFRRELAKFDRYVAEFNCFSILHVNYVDVIADPRKQAERINQFLGGQLDVEAMAGVVTPRLYRQREQG